MGYLSPLRKAPVPAVLPVRQSLLLHLVWDSDGAVVSIAAIYGCYQISTKQTEGQLISDHMNIRMLEFGSEVQQQSGFQKRCLLGSSL